MSIIDEDNSENVRPVHRTRTARPLCVRGQGDFMSQSPPDPSSPSSPFPFAPQDALEFMQKMWNPFGVPIPGFGMPGAPGVGGMPGMVPGAQPGGMPFPNPAAMYATLDPAEVERKINELKVIEGWLTMTLHWMQMSIKTMELQKASLEALRAAHAPAGAAKGAPESGRK
jgi:hypothetical protein